ncbi:MAG: HesA/MoeB/ThiF family protein [Atribacterota bacterium]
MDKIPENLSKELKIIKKQSDKTIDVKYIPVISIKKVQGLAEKYNLSFLNIEIAALRENIMPERYERNYDSISFSEQIKLLSSNVAVIGCGGLGGSIIEMLARLGVGNLILVDGDTFKESNLNRQLISTENKIGKNKAEVAAERITKINSSVKIKSCPQFVDATNIQQVIQGADLAIDALDNIPSRFVLAKACRELKIPFIHGAINGFNGQVSTIFPQDKGLEAIYGPPQRYDQENKKERVSAPSFSPTMIASFQVAETIKVLLNRGKNLRNKLLLINIEELEINVVEIK